MSNVTRVYFMDGTSRAVSYDNSTTVEQLWASVAEKLHLQPDSQDCFFLWVWTDQLEILLFAESKIVEVLREWPEMWNKYRYRPKGLLAAAAAATAKFIKTKDGDIKKIQKSFSALDVNTHKDDANVPELQLMFRTAGVLPLSIERNIRDPVAVSLFYMQAKYNVIASNYPCTEKVAVQLAGLQAQITLGNFNAEKHQPGFYGHDLKYYVPQHLIGKKKPAEWEAKIFKAHKKHAGKEPFILQLLYLQLVRQWPYYGSTFFLAEFKPSVQSFYKQPFEGEVRVGVNGYGVHIIDPKQMKIVSHRYEDLRMWDADDKLFFFETGSDEAPEKHLFLTPQGELISDLMHDWCAELEQQQKEIEEERQRQTKK